MELSEKISILVEYANSLVAKAESSEALNCEGLDKIVELISKEAPSEEAPKDAEKADHDLEPVESAKEEAKKSAKVIWPAFDMNSEKFEKPVW